jgi:hypothetical protein
MRKRRDRKFWQSAEITFTINRLTSVQHAGPAMLNIAASARKGFLKYQTTYLIAIYNFLKGSERVKGELGFAQFCLRKMGSCTFAGIFRGKNTIENRNGMTIGAEHLGLVRLVPILSLMWVFGGYNYIV